MELKGRVPARVINIALKAARIKGEMPPFTEEALLQALQLDGDEPDGLTLMDRLTAEPQSLVVGVVRLVRDVPRLIANVKALLYAVNADSANDAQEAIAHMLGQMVTRQVLREEDICPLAQAMAMACKREDIISEEVKAKLPPESED